MSQVLAGKVLSSGDAAERERFYEVRPPHSKPALYVCVILYDIHVYRGGVEGGGWPPVERWPPRSLAAAVSRLLHLPHGPL